MLASVRPPGLPDPRRLFDLDGRVAVVTGASSGLGEGLARALAGAGAKVALVARRYDRLEKLAGEIGGHPVAADLLDLERLGEIVPQVVDALGPPEILVNAAGNVFTRERAEDEPLDAIVQTVNLNLVAAYRLAQEVHPHMIAAGRGSIVNISSISAHVGIPGIPNAAYAASKSGLSGLTADLALEWGRKAIRVNTISPGFFPSEITQSLYEDPKGDAWLARNTPLPYHATVEDFVGAVLWLASDAGRFVTGQTIVIDGGWTIA
jgi:NAD(P)-dependent dehydrogenase (short-subunit alcohol dehydrogenase family)